MRGKAQLTDLSLSEHLLFSALFLLFGFTTFSTLYLWFIRFPLLIEKNVWCLSILLAGCAAGVAFGKSLYLRQGRRARQSRVLFALLQVLFGIFNFLVLRNFPEVPSAFARILVDLEIWQFDFIFYTLAFLLPLTPGFLWGFSLSCIESSVPSLGHRSEELYTRLYLLFYAGAVLGVVLLQSQLLSSLGISNSSSLIALTCLLSSLVATMLTYAGRRNEALHERHLLGFKLAFRLHAAAFLSGALLFAFIILWFRAFLLLAYDAVDIFHTLSVTLLFTFGLGSAVAATWLRRQGYFRFTTPITALLACLASILLYQVFFLHLNNPVFDSSKLFDDLMLRCFVLCAASGLLNGMLLTSLRSSIIIASKHIPDARTLYRVSICCGALMGSILGGFILLPQLGLERATLTISLGYVIVALFCLERPSGKHVLGRTAILAMLCLVVISAFPFGILRDQYYHFARSRLQKVDPDARASLNARWHADLDHTLMIFEYDFIDRIMSQQILSNGVYRTGTTVSEERANRIPALLPMAFNPGIKSVLQLGASQATQVILKSDTLTKLELIEPSQSLLEVFADYEDSRLIARVRPTGKFLLTEAGSYDLILFDKFQPEIRQSHQFTSIEYLRLLRTHLSPVGVLSYRLPIRRMAATSFGSIVSTFCQVYPDCTLWKSTPLDYILLGSVRGESLQLDEEDFSRQWRNSSLSNIGLEKPEQLLATFLAGPEQLKVFRDSYGFRTLDRIDSDTPTDTAVASFFLELSNFTKARERFETSLHMAENTPEGLWERTSSYFSLEPLVDFYVYQPHRPRTFPSHPENVHRVLKQSSLKALPLWMFSTSSFEVQAARSLSEIGAGGHVLEFLLGVSELSERRYKQALGHFTNALAMKPDSSVYITSHAYALCYAGQVKQLKRLIEKLDSSSDPAQQKVLSWLRDNC